MRLRWTMKIAVARRVPASPLPRFLPHSSGDTFLRYLCSFPALSDFLSCSNLDNWIPSKRGAAQPPSFHSTAANNVPLRKVSLSAPGIRAIPPRRFFLPAFSRLQHCRRQQCNHQSCAIAQLHFPRCRRGASRLFRTWSLFLSLVFLFSSSLALSFTTAISRTSATRLMGQSRRPGAVTRNQETAFRSFGLSSW